MINTTILALQTYYFTSASPLLSINNKYGIQKISFCSSYFNYFISPIIFSYTNKYSTIIKDIKFMHGLNSPIRLINSDCIYENIKINNQLKYNNECNLLHIIGCTFSECHTEDDGGAILITSVMNISVYGSIFDKCSSNYRGAAVSISYPDQVLETTIL